MRSRRTYGASFGPRTISAFFRTFFGRFQTFSDGFRTCSDVFGRVSDGFGDPIFFSTYRPAAQFWAWRGSRRIPNFFLKEILAFGLALDRAAPARAAQGQAEGQNFPRSYEKAVGSSGRRFSETSL